ncbi:MAG: hypothetical protein IT165_22590 [Bryobacterales bacterium]|nr:hypothetical protein [Bryobacterales bacterium]
MAKQAPSNYLQSMCVRNALLAAWTTLEMACRDALGVTRFKGQDFKRNLNEELRAQGKPPVDFGTGTWGLLSSKTLKHRTEYAHAGVRLADRFPSVSHADDAIAWVRQAIHDIYGRMGKTPPKWIDHDQSTGWPTEGTRFGAFGTVTRQSADPSQPGVVKIVLVTPDGEERTTEYLSSTTTDEEIYGWIEDVLGKLNSPFARIRAYRGVDVIHDEELEIRG